MAIKQQLVDAFSESFRDSLKDPASEIEKQLEGLLKYLKNECPKCKFQDNITYRVKSQKSFAEKLDRKGYLDKWNINVKSTNDEIQSFVKKNLKDIIGCRIVCYFWNEEEQITKSIKKWYDELADKSQITSFVPSDKKQKNVDNIIHKFDGVYTNCCCFELQVKCFMHNLWGEVDHDILYKSEDYTTDFPLKKMVIENLFQTLKASDEQLRMIYESKPDEKTAVMALFYELTHENIAKENRDSLPLLRAPYSAFFYLFFKEERRYENLKSFVGKALLKQEYTKTKLSSRITKEKQEVANLLKADFGNYQLQLIYEVFNQIYVAKDFDHFLFIILDILDGKEEQEKAFDIKDLDNDDGQEAESGLADRYQHTYKTILKENCYLQSVKEEEESK